MEIQARKDMDTAFQWDLSAIYESEAAWEAAFADAQKMVAGLSSIPGTLGTSAQALADGLGTVYQALEKVERVYIYAMLCISSDNGDAHCQEMEGRAMNLCVAISTATSFMAPEILAIDPQTLAEYRKSPALDLYNHLLDDTIRGRAHMLDAAREEMLAKLGDAAGGFKKTFEMLESVDLTFPTIKDENGADVALSHGNFGVFRESRMQSVRRESFEKYFGAFNAHINTFAAMYAGQVKMDCYFSAVRGHASACEAALFERNVPVAVYDSLCEAVHDALPDMRRYLELRRHALGLEELNMYDLYCPMVDEVEYHVPYEDAKELVRRATAPLGPRYAELLERAFSEKWIDVYENKGKTTGAFSCGVFGAHPYVLLNFTETLDDAFTLAHELGHSMHSFFSDEAQAFANHDYLIMVAEVASTVNEVLLTKYLLSVEKDKKRRAYILNHFLEGFRTTVFRQTLFAEFERMAHDQYQAGKPLTASVLNGLYRSLNERYYEGAVINELQDIEWARIPHFYRPFYVFQYATGFCSAVAIANNILKTGDATPYLRFLTTGGSDYPMEELKIAGVDLAKPETVRTSLTVFADSLTELEGLLN